MLQNFLKRSVSVLVSEIEGIVQMTNYHCAIFYSSLPKERIN